MYTSFLKWDGVIGVLLNENLAGSEQARTHNVDFEMLWS